MTPIVTVTTFSAAEHFHLVKVAELAAAVQGLKNQGWCPRHLPSLLEEAVQEAKNMFLDEEVTAILDAHGNVTFRHSA